jgi:hypothetical protein
MIVKCPHCGNTDLEQFLYLENAIVHRRLIEVVGKTLRIEADYDTTPCDDDDEAQHPRLMCSARGCDGGCFDVPSGLRLDFIG